MHCVLVQDTKTGAYHIIEEHDFIRLKAEVAKDWFYRFYSFVVPSGTALPGEFSNLDAAAEWVYDHTT